jgi:hypothetical protein
MLKISPPPGFDPRTVQLVIYKTVWSENLQEEKEEKRKRKRKKSLKTVFIWLSRAANGVIL